MNYRLTTFMLAAVLILGLGVSSIQAAPKETVQPAPQAVAPAGTYIFANAGTGWVPEVVGQYNWWHPRGWGMQAKPKTVGEKWVHIPITIPTWIADSTMWIDTAYFCAQSANGAAGTGPNRMDVWDDNVMIATSNITWYGDNAYHCWGMSFTATSVSSLSISVSLNFANTTHMITLGKAYVWTSPP